MKMNRWLLNMVFHHDKKVSIITLWLGNSRTRCVFCVSQCHHFFNNSAEFDMIGFQKFKVTSNQHQLCEINQLNSFLTEIKPWIRTSFVFMEFFVKYISSNKLQHSEYFHKQYCWFSALLLLSITVKIFDTFFFISDNVGITVGL